MSRLQGQYQCFRCLISVSVLSAGTREPKRLSSLLKCCSCYFCTVVRREEADVSPSLDTGWTQSDRRATSGGLNGHAVVLCEFAVFLAEMDLYKNVWHIPVFKSMHNGLRYQNEKRTWKTHYKKTGIALINSDKVKENCFFYWTTERFMFNIFFVAINHLKSTSTVASHSFNHIQSWFVYHYYFAGGSPYNTNKCDSMKTEMDWNILWSQYIGYYQQFKETQPPHQRVSVSTK